MANTGTDGVRFDNRSSIGGGDGGVQLPIWSSGMVATEPDSAGASTVANHGNEDVSARVSPKQSSSPVSLSNEQAPIGRMISRHSQFSIRATISSDVDFSWHHVSVEIPEQPKKNIPHKTIIDDINGKVKAGSLLAIMGASGAGKTTFLNLLTDRTASALEVTGTIAINNAAVRTSEIRKISSYVQQQDLFFGTLTVLEHLTVQALLRMNKTLSQEERLHRVHEVLDELGLAKVTNSFIGSVAGGLRGISGGEQKRLAFATEVLTDPPLLFADEPTTGLDSFASQSVVAHLKHMAESGRTILCTIHQPPSEVFSMFDQLLLLAEGRTAFLGPRADAVEHFSRIGYTCPSGFNPADFYIYTLAVDPADREGSKAQIKAITDKFIEEEDRQGVRVAPVPEPNVRMNKAMKELGQQHGEGLATQLRVVGWRTFKLTVRDRILIQINIFTTLLTSLVMGLVFLNTADEDRPEDRVQGVAGAMFFVIALSAFTGAGNITQTVPAERPVFLREHENGMYKMGVYFVCKYLSTIPVTLLLQLAAQSIMYFMFGLNSDASRFFLYYVIIIVTIMSAESVGYLLSAIAGDNVAVAFALTPIGTVPLMLFSGLLLNLNDTPPYFIWLEKISYLRWGWEAAMINEWRNDALANPLNTTTFFSSGNDVLKSYALETDTSYIGINIAISLGLAVGYRALALIITYITLKVGVRR